MLRRSDGVTDLLGQPVGPVSLLLDPTRRTRNVSKTTSLRCVTSQKNEDLAFSHFIAFKRTVRLPVLSFQLTQYVNENADGFKWG